MREGVPGAHRNSSRLFEECEAAMIRQEKAILWLGALVVLAWAFIVWATP